MLSQFNSSKSGFDGASGAASRIILAAYFCSLCIRKRLVFDVLLQNNNAVIY